VTRKFDIGAREVYYDQVVKGGIGVFPEYNGALLSVAVDKKSTATSTEEINAELKAKLPKSVEILDSAAAEDKDSVTVTSEIAAKYKLKTLADLKPVAKDMTIGAGSEFKTRTQGGVGLKTVYGVEFGKFQPLDAGAQSTLLKLLKDNKVQAANLYTTDPAIVEDKLVVLEDPKNLFSSQNVTPLVYKSAVERQGQGGAQRPLGQAHHRGPAGDDEEARQRQGGRLRRRQGVADERRSRRLTPTVARSVRTGCGRSGPLAGAMAGPATSPSTRAAGRGGPG
jgi:glycine betaine/choline ABC-type transport system substrate-binding protein